MSGAAREEAVSCGLVADKPSLEEARRIMGTLSAKEAEALVSWYAALSRNVSAFPKGELRGVEPPLRSTPGPLSK